MLHLDLLGLGSSKDYDCNTLNIIA